MPDRLSTVSDQPSASHPLAIGFAVALPSAVVCLTECIFREVHRSFLVQSSIGPTSLVFGPYFVLVPLLTLTTFLCLTMDRNALLGSAVGYTCAIILMIRFRGSHYWPGTFDMAHASYLHSFLPLLLSIVSALLLHRTWPIVKLQSIKTLIILGAVLAIALTWTFINSFRDIGLYTLAPYTRHFALMAVFVSAGAIIVASQYIGDPP